MYLDILRRACKVCAMAVLCERGVGRARLKRCVCIEVWVFSGVCVREVSVEAYKEVCGYRGVGL